jgi:hypothetical protein
MYRQFWSLCRKNRSEERKGGGKGNWKKRMRFTGAKK